MVSKLEVRAKAAAVRVKRMRKSLIWSVLLSTVVDRTIHSGFSGSQTVGSNILLFAILAVVIHFVLKGKILDTDPGHFVWRQKSPWLLIYWPVALLSIVVLNLRYA